MNTTRENPLNPTYRIQLRHTVVDTDESVKTKILDTAPLTARSLARVWRRWKEETDYIRRVFGPNVIRPKHSFYCRVIREDGSCVKDESADFAIDPDTGLLTNTVEKVYMTPIDPLAYGLGFTDPEKSWGQNAADLLRYVRKWDELNQQTAAH